METIKNYLENVFSNLPQSEDILVAKEELLCMMEDKYNELKLDGKTENEAIGIVISEFGNINEIIENLEPLPYEENKDTIETATNKFINLDTAMNFISETTEISKKISLGVMLCIWSPIAALLLWGFSKNNILPINIEVSCAIGIIVLLAMVMYAVSLFINFGLKLEKYDHLKKEKFELDYSTKSFIKTEDENFRPVFAKRIALGVSLCVLSLIPAAVSSLTLGNSISVLYPSVTALLLIVAFAVRIFIVTGMKFDSYKVLLQEGDYSTKLKENQLFKGEEQLSKTIASIYWPAIVFIYIAWNFISKDYEVSWILWPLAGILFAIILNICNAIEKKSKTIS